MKVENSLGIDYSNDRTFTTLSPPIGWLHQSSGTTNYLYDVDFVDENTGTAVGGNSTILRTLDGGLTWNAQINSLTGEWIFGVDFIKSE